MKVLFLDIDGVLNSTEAVIANPWNANAKMITLDEMGVNSSTIKHVRAKAGLYHGEINPDAVKLLRKVCNELNLSVVLSSTWRTMFTVEQMNTVLSYFDKKWKDLIVDETPTMHGRPRGEEIQMWLDNHPEVTEYVIMDDGDDMLKSQDNNFVRTNYATGLTVFDLLLVTQIIRKKAKCLPHLDELLIEPTLRTFERLSRNQ